MAVQSDYEFMSTTNNATINGLVGATLGFVDHKVGVMTMYVHDTDKETRSSEGYSLLTGDNVRDDTTHWIEREMNKPQPTGAHAFGEYRDSEQDWRAGPSADNRGDAEEDGRRARRGREGTNGEI